MLRKDLTFSLILMLLVCSWFLPHPTLSVKENVRVGRMMPPKGPGGPGGPPPGPGPMNPPSPPSTKGTREAPPPVTVNFTTSCRLQQADYRHITCDENGNFTDIQCMGKTCFCVDTETGERLNSRSFPEREKLATNCSAEFNCPNLVGCNRVCDGGFRTDPEGCSMCRCAPPPPPLRCNTVTMLISDLGCHCRCVTQGDTTPRGGPRTRMMGRCPSCDDDCNMNPPASVEGCVVTDPNQCPDGTTLQSVGRSGNPMCVPDLEDASDCKPAVEEEDRSGPKLKGADKRRRARDLGTATTPCRKGFVCRQIDFMEYQCFSENAESPCVMARTTDSNIDCEPNGNFKPLQCSPVVESPGNGSNVTSTSEEMSRSRGSRSRGTRTRTSSRGQQTCRCVEPVNGTTIVGSELLLGVRDKRPNCNNVYRDCEVPGVYQHRGPRSRTYKVRHGEDFFDTTNCRTCQCINGDLTSFCTPMADCSVLLPDNTTNNCTLEDGEVLVHSETKQVGCDVCGCKDGRLRCTQQKDCEDKEDNTTVTNPCDMCNDQPASPVCGPDGRNHRSRCYAIYCAGIPALELEDGPCQSQNPCDEHPCDVNKVCVRRGAVACMATSGCTPDQLRTCVNITALNCPIETPNSGNGTNSTNEETLGEDAVCGSDNETYASLCQLVQTTTNVHVAHTGPCEDPECQGGEVCGSDGVTYPNSCNLESLATTRVDYPGACVRGNSAEEICATVINEGRCVVNSDNCDNLVFPQDGCCPICGGSVSVVVDRAALSDVARTNPELQTVDVFAFRMTEDEVFEGIEEKCTIEATPTDTNDLQLALPATDKRHSSFCLRKSKEIAERVNIGNLPSNGSQPGTVAIVPLPQVYEFAMAAVAAQEVVEPGSSTTDGTGGGAPGLFPTYLSVIFVCIIAAVMRLM